MRTVSQPMAARMRSLVLLASLALSGAWAAPARADGSKTRTIIALLNGGQEGATNTSNAFGIAFLTFAKDTKMLCY